MRGATTNIIYSSSPSQGMRFQRKTKKSGRHSDASFKSGRSNAFRASPIEDTIPKFKTANRDLPHKFSRLIGPALFLAGWAAIAWAFT